MRLHPGELALVQGAVHQVGQQLVGMIHASSSDVRDAPEGSPRVTPSARPKASPAPEDPRFHRSHGDLEHGRDLVGREVLHVREHQDDAELLRDLGERLRHVDGEHHPFRVIGRGEGRLRALVAHRRGPAGASGVAASCGGSRSRR